MHDIHNAEAYKRTAYFLSIDTKPFEGSDLEQTFLKHVFERNFDFGTRR